MRSVQHLSGANRHDVRKRKSHLQHLLLLLQAENYGILNVPVEIKPKQGLPRGAHQIPPAFQLEVNL